MDAQSLMWINCDLKIVFLLSAFSILKKLSEESSESSN